MGIRARHHRREHLHHARCARHHRKEKRVGGLKSLHILAEICLRRSMGRVICARVMSRPINMGTYPRDLQEFLNWCEGHTDVWTTVARPGFSMASVTAGPTKLAA